MPKVNLITPPDQMYNQNISILLIDPKDDIKNDFNNVLKTNTNDINLYLWETQIDHNDYKWLIQVINSVDKIIIDLDNTNVDRWLVGYILSFGKCFYVLNQIDNKHYEMINSNRIYDLKSIQNELEKNK